MKRRHVSMLLAAALLLLPLRGSSAEDQPVEPIYGESLMTAEERAEHRERLGAAVSEEARAQIRAEHHERMQARAEAQGVPQPDGATPGAKVRGRDRTTEQERAQHRAEMRTHQSEKERGRARAEHHPRMKERARERGVEIPDEPPARRPGKGRGGADGRR